MSYEQLATSVDALAVANRTLTDQVLETQEAVDLAATQAQQSATASAASAELARQYAEDASEVVGMQNPMTTSQDLIVGGTAGAPVRLPVGSNGNVLSIANGAVAWQPAPDGAYVPPEIIDKRGMSFTLEAGHANKLIRVGVGGVATITIPADSTVNFPIGTEIILQSAGVEGITVVGASGAFISKDTRITFPIIGDFGDVILRKYAENNWMISCGNMTNPMLLAGDLITLSDTGTPKTARISVGNNGQVLTVVGGMPTWAASAANYVYMPTVSKAAATTLGLTDAGKYIRVTAATAVNITVPAQTATAWLADTEITIEQAGAGAVTLVAGSGVTLNKMASNTLTLAGQFGVVTLKRTASNVWTVFGALGV